MPRWNTALSSSNEVVPASTHSAAGPAATPVAKASPCSSPPARSSTASASRLAASSMSGLRHGRQECPGQAVLIRFVVRVPELRVVVEELDGLDAVVHALRPPGVFELVEGGPQPLKDRSHGPLLRSVGASRTIGVGATSGVHFANVAPRLPQAHDVTFPLTAGTRATS